MNQGHSLRLTTIVFLSLAACSEPPGENNEAAIAASCAPLTIAGVSASGNDGNVPQNVIDGNLATRWSSDGIGQFITADLGAPKTICTVAIAWYRGNVRTSKFTVATSTDGSSFTQIYSGTSSGTTTALETYDVPDTSARYVRVTVNGNTENTWASITELQITGASAAQAETLFGTTAPPSGDAADPDTAAVELGVRFTAAVSGQVAAIRFYRAKANTAGYSVHLWTSTGTLLASASGNDGALPGWREIALPSAVSISANTTYVASYFTSNGSYAGTNGGFSTPMTSGDLTAPIDAGVYRYGSSPGFPTGTYQSSNYWVDVSFVPGSGSSSDTTPPSVSIASPTNGSTVSGTVTVSANASDNVGVAGVQFLLDGTSLGSEDTSSPYSTSLSSTSVSNGSHTLTARARDAAGNSTLSAPISINVSNTSTASTIPLSFNDPLFSGSPAMVSPSSTVALQNGASAANLSFTFDTPPGNSGDPVIVMFGNNTVTRTRMYAREGYRVAGSGLFRIDGSWIEAQGVADDHADGLQAYSPGSTGTIYVTSSTFRAYSGAATAGMFVADNWTGTVRLENVVFWGGPYGLRLHSDVGGDLHIYLKNVYFVGPFSYGPYLITGYGGTRAIIEQWENVRQATISNGVLVPGALMPQPST